eukprot:2001784-Prymnesium_polylepis.1
MQLARRRPVSRAGPRSNKVLKPEKFCNDAAAQLSLARRARAADHWTKMCMSMSDIRKSCGDSC